jgi:CubicO group peptidase (beta-lactamase class C family)
MESSYDWVKYTIDRPMSDEPGMVFNYSSGVSQLLSHIFRAATGQDIEEYAARNLFAPLGIEHYYWKRSPTGLVDTEGGLYLNRRDLARIGCLFLNNGAWRGRQIVEADWVRSSVRPSVTATTEGVKYGFKWWLYPYQGERLAWAASGFGGQRLIVLPEYDLVLVYTGWNILPEGRSLGYRDAIDRVLRALIEERRVKR